MKNASRSVVFEGFSISIRNSECDKSDFLTRVGSVLNQTVSRFSLVFNFLGFAGQSSSMIFQLLLKAATVPKCCGHL